LSEENVVQVPVESFKEWQNAAETGGTPRDDSPLTVESAADDLRKRRKERAPIVEFKAKDSGPTTIREAARDVDFSRKFARGVSC
jgi:hypothetical protein